MPGPGAGDSAPVVLLDYDEAAALLSGGEQIHTVLDAGPVAVGADWARVDVLALLRRTSRREITGPRAQAEGYGLAAWICGRPLFIETRTRHAGPGLGGTA